MAAKLGGSLFERMKLPSVLGELLVGIVLGNLALFGFDGLDFLKVDYDSGREIDLHDVLTLAGVTIDHLARIGVVLLLFLVGLETKLKDFWRVGPSALLVACLGVIAPMGLGYGASLLAQGHHDWTVHLFVGATLCATSVGITARVLRDMGKSTTSESRIILGAAVIDDVLGLVVLAVVQGLILAQSSGGTGGLDLVELAIICGKALGFLFGALLIGPYLSRGLFHAANQLHGSGLLLVTALGFCFGMAWLSAAVGLAPIVGAFAAGLVLDHVQYRELAARGSHELEELVRPVGELFIPIFFVMMGIQVDLRSFLNPSVLGLAAILTVAAIIGKQVCGLGVLERGVDRMSVGFGMIPRGEVGLIFASIGRQLRVDGERVVGDGLYSALILMVIVTTLVTPPLLQWSMARIRTPDPSPSEAAA
jgi:Kef-type K+ transport system membrane component KefB